MRAEENDPLRLEARGDLPREPTDHAHWDLGAPVKSGTLRLMAILYAAVENGSGPCRRARGACCHERTELLEPYEGRVQLRQRAEPVWAFFVW